VSKEKQIADKQKKIDELNAAKGKLDEQVQVLQREIDALKGSSDAAVKPEPKQEPKPAEDPKQAEPKEDAPPVTQDVVPEPKEDGAAAAKGGKRRLKKRM